MHTFHKKKPLISILCRTYVLSPFLTAHVWNEAIMRKDPDLPDPLDFQNAMYMRARTADLGSSH